VLLNAYVQEFAAEIRRVKAEPVIYMVWPSRARAPDFDGVSQSYAGAAALVKGLLCPAGDAWRAAWRRDPALALYGPDGFHPSPLGSTLAALTIFHRLTGTFPRAIDGVPPRTYETLKAAVTEASRE